ncbi:MAG: ammonia-forming cytochrome c nitrite reductase subunit c552 [Methylococcales bacterium]|nr:ammonia-forming cytochrome c nitrite reductase subunit c552 [Methylococcales bacterium]
MTRRKIPKQPPFNTRSNSATKMQSVIKRWSFLLLAVCLSVLVMAGIYIYLADTKPAAGVEVSVEKPAVTPVVSPPEVVASVEPENYVGAESCKECHQTEFQAWQGSHHQLAMQEANEQSVLGDFNNAKFNYHGFVSTFFKRDGKFMVRTDGKDGKLTDYAISYTFGVTPLQQYLIEFDGGRYQALSIAWDSRPKADGGQKWFHLYPNEKVNHNDQLHWTKRYQNWNMECAECHSTHLQKGYDAATDSYKTTFSEINVACESCHGAASKHIDWAKQAKPPTSIDNKGLAVKLQSHWKDAWQFADKADIAQRDELASDELMNTCWACHARRLPLVENSPPSLPLEDTHKPSLLTQPTYHADGQQRDEDYTWGSFRQSKMFQQGVTCMDCHEPHSLKLRAEGNALCTRCHNAEKFDTEKHHKHKADSKGALCMDCHAPEQNYMVNDGRHDHSFRLPRPDLSLSLGSPNACTQCHAKQKPEWAASAMDKWYGKSWRERPHYGTTLHAGVTDGIKALPSLLELAQNAATPAIVRATAVTLIKPMMSPDLLTFAREQLKDTDPSVRVAGLELIESLDPINRSLSASPLLDDSVRGVRIEAARVLADIPDSEMSANRMESRNNAMQEYMDAMKLNADWPAENSNLGNLYLRQGKIDKAITAYQRALTLDPQFVGAYINLADAYRQQQHDDEGEQQLRKGLALIPDEADLHHALGLLLVRKGDKTAALKEFAKATKLAPTDARYSYVYAIALNSLGKQHKALSVLKAVDKRQPHNLQILSALISMHREAGDNKTALVYARKAAEALPNNKEIAQLITELEGAK